MVGLIGLDFETYSDVDLKKHGLARYVRSPNFTPLVASMCSTDVTNGALKRARFDIRMGRNALARAVRYTIDSRSIVAQNAGFEWAVLDWLGLDYPANRFIDSAVVARTAGAGSHLEAAAPQLLDVDKMASGLSLIKLFSIPGKYQEANGNGAFDARIIDDNPLQWEEFGEYCDLDSELGLRLAETFLSWLTSDEMYYQAMTMQMNRVGWPVDISLVRAMQDRYHDNMAAALLEFSEAYPDAADLNLNSLKQMKEWCLKRGIKANSFDEKHVASLHKRITQKVMSGTLGPDKFDQYNEVLHLLRTKQILGGSSLKKLQVIIDTQLDGRLKDQYVHCGAGQTLRTSGRSVQMQNLKQLDAIADIDEVYDEAIDWDNDMLASNLRQCFTSSHRHGRLIVGDFKSVESRGLAYLADETWKLNAYRRGDDIYQLLADKFGNTRKFGKVGELSCGYGAGGGAVQSFASKMGIEMTEGEANGLVHDWRDVCPSTLELWLQLDDMLRTVVTRSTSEKLVTGGGLTLSMRPVTTPESLRRQHPKAQSVAMTVATNSGKAILKRYFHGCYTRGRNVAYYKPSDRKTGDLWSATFKDPKTKQLRYYELYGGKLAGILTQSLCREIFMYVMTHVDAWCKTSGATLVGQFHDELVVDWTPSVNATRGEATLSLQQIMSTAPHWLPGFPLDAEIKSAYRYIK